MELLDEERRSSSFKPKRFFLSQGNPAESIFFLQSGRAKLTVVSESGKDATIMLLSPGDFIGEESVDSAGKCRLATAAAITACTALKIEKQEISGLIHERDAFSELFLKLLVGRNMRVQANLVDQLFNCTEKRLARILLSMAESCTLEDPEPLIPTITQEALAGMIGTTRSRVNFFMNRFRDLGFIDYKGRIRVNESLHSVLLHD